MRRIWAQRMEPSEAEAEELARLSAEYDELAASLEAGEGTEDEQEAASVRADAIQDRVADITEGLNRFDPQEQPHAGCIVSVNHSGELSVSGGWVRVEDWPAILALRGLEPLTPNESPTEPAPAEDTDTGTLSAALIEELTAIRTAALRVEMTSQPIVALAAILHPLLVRTFYTGPYGYASIPSAVEVRGELKTLDTAIQKPTSHKAVVEWTAHLEAVKLTLPHDAALLWDWLVSQETPALLDLLATVSAANTNAIRYRHDSRKDGRVQQADQIASAVDLDMSRWWKPDAEFLDRLSKKAMGNVMRGQGIGEDRIASMQKLPKHEAVHRTEAEIGGRGYMPECLTVPKDESPEAEDNAEAVAQDVEPIEDSGEADAGSYAVAAE